MTVAEDIENAYVCNLAIVRWSWLTRMSILKKKWAGNIISTFKDYLYIYFNKNLVVDNITILPEMYSHFLAELMLILNLTFAKFQKYKSNKEFKK